MIREDIIKEKVDDLFQELENIGHYNFIYTPRITVILDKIREYQKICRHGGATKFTKEEVCPFCRKDY